MRRRMALTRIVVAAALTVLLNVAALRMVPGATAAVQIRMMAFVLVAPWLIALVVVRPAQLVDAFAAAFLGRTPGEGSATLRVLEFLGGMTVTAGAVGALGSLFASYEALGWIKYVIREDVHGVVAAMILPPAFALIVRLTLFEPVVWSLRRQFGTEDVDNARSAKIRARWKAVMIVAATVLVLEGSRALIRSRHEEPEEPVHDTSIAAVAVDPASAGGQKSREGVKPIRVEVIQTPSGPECRVDGKPLVARPGHEDEVHDRILWLKKKDNHRPVEIDVAPSVPFQHVVALLDACVRVKVARIRAGGSSDYWDFRILIHTERPFTMIQRVRLVWEDQFRGPILLQLPRSKMAEPLSTVWERE